jgi:hypothetical protein
MVAESVPAEGPPLLLLDLEPRSDAVRSVQMRMPTHFVLPHVLANAAGVSNSPDAGDERYEKLDRPCDELDKDNVEEGPIGSHEVINSSACFFIASTRLISHSKLLRHSLLTSTVV